MSRKDLFKDKTYDDITKLMVKCKCGSSTTIANKKGYRVCKRCKNLVFVNIHIEHQYRKDEFKKRLRRKLNE